MLKEEAKKRIEKLRQVIDHNRYLYHVLDKQELSPEALDSLKHELFLLEQQYPDLVTLDSPTQRIGGKPLDKFGKIKHDVPMLSLEDIFKEEELYDWKKHLKRLDSKSNFEYFCELKIDGFAISLIYENGLLKTGSTRGDGMTGEDVLQNLKTIESIPLRLKDSKGVVEIRGEVYMDKLAFEKVNQRQVKAGESIYANPRNLAAGSIRQLDPKLAASRDLKFLAYDIIADLGQKTHSQEHQILKELGFKTDKGRICKNIQEIISFWKDVFKNRSKLPFLIDGIVINVNDNQLFKSLGIAGKSPRAGRAFKFSPKQTTAKIKDIKIQIGRTGSATPVALLEPVQLEGITISRATLHNEDEIKRLGLKIGDTVVIQRAGDVIPAVDKALPELRTGNEKLFAMPKKCPVCDTELMRPKEEVVWRCPNADCPARKRENFYHFSSRKAFNIEGLGPKIIDQLVENNLISDPSEIFEIQEGDLLSLERFAQKSASKLVNSIKSKKGISLPRFIYSLGIRHVGEETALDLAKRFKDINDLAKASKEDLKDIAEIGPVASESIYKWFRNPKNLNLLKKLKEVGVKIHSFKEESLKLSDQKFVVTGSLDSMSREMAQEKIRVLGGDINDSVSKNTDYVVVGKDPGSKFKKAQQLGVKTLNEQEFLNLIQ